LLSHPAVLDAGVTGKYSIHGDLLIGVVKVKSGQNVAPDVLVSYVNGKILQSWIIIGPAEMCLVSCCQDFCKYFSDRVKDYERLRGGIIFVDDVPRSPAGKLKREELLKLVQ